MERELKEKRVKIKAFQGLPPVNNSFTSIPFLPAKIFSLRISNSRDMSYALHDNDKWNSFNFVNDCSVAWLIAFLSLYFVFQDLQML